MSKSLDRKCSVLYADDEASLREQFLMFVEDTRWVPTVVRDGAEALNSFTAGSFDVVLTDFNMPRMNGGRLAAAVKTLDARQPVIILTGSPILEGEMAAANLVLAKPISRDALLTALNSFV